MSRLDAVCYFERGGRPETPVSAVEQPIQSGYRLSGSISVPLGAELLDFLGALSVTGVYLVQCFPEQPV